MPERETEITLGAGRILGLFFGLVIVCAIFFVSGYRLGKNSLAGNKPLTDVPAVPSANAPAVQPAASQTAMVIKSSATPEGSPSAETPAADAPQNPATAPAPPAPEPVRAGPNTGYIVQVAAVSKHEDADALVAALRRKQYQVFTATVTSDTLFHVQIGPFADSKDAEAIRMRLISDGYNPIVKR